MFKSEKLGENEKSMNCKNEVVEQVKASIRISDSLSISRMIGGGKWYAKQNGY